MRKLTFEDLLYLLIVFLLYQYDYKKSKEYIGFVPLVLAVTAEPIVEPIVECNNANSDKSEL